MMLITAHGVSVCGRHIYPPDCTVRFYFGFVIFIAVTLFYNLLLTVVIDRKKVEFFDFQMFVFLKIHGFIFYLLSEFIF